MNITKLAEEIQEQVQGGASVSDIIFLLDGLRTDGWISIEDRLPEDDETVWVHYDKKMSNDNWVVCPKIPLSVILSGTSKNCEDYKESKNEILVNSREGSTRNK